MFKVHAYSKLRRSQPPSQVSRQWKGFPLNRHLDILASISRTIFFGNEPISTVHRRPFPTKACAKLIATPACRNVSRFLRTRDLCFFKASRIVTSSAGTDFIETIGQLFST